MAPGIYRLFPVPVFTPGLLILLALPVAYVVSFWLYTAFIIELSMNDCLSLHMSALSLDCFAVWSLMGLLPPLILTKAEFAILMLCLIS